MALLEDELLLLLEGCKLIDLDNNGGENTSLKQEEQGNSRVEDVDCSRRYPQAATRPSVAESKSEWGGM